MRRPLLATAAVLWLGCTTGPTISDVRLSVAVSAAELTVGQVDTVVVTATNTTNRSFTLHFGSTCQVLPYIRRAGGAVVLPPGGAWGCGQALTTLSFAPRESKRSVYLWGGSDAWMTEMPLRALPAGTYELFAEMRASEFATTALPVRVQLLQ